MTAVVTDVATLTNVANTNQSSRFIDAAQAAFRLVKENGKDLTIATLPAGVASALNNKAFDDYPAAKIIAQGLAFAPDFLGMFSEEDGLIRETIGQFQAYREHGDGEDLADGAMNVTILALALGAILGQASTDPDVIADSDEAARSYAVLRDFLILAGGVEERTQEDVNEALEEWLSILPDEVTTLEGDVVQKEKKRRHDLEVGQIVRIFADDEKPCVPAIGEVVGAADGTRLQMQNTTGEHFHYRPYQGMEVGQGSKVLSGYVDVRISTPAAESNMEANVQEASEADTPQASANIKNTILYAVLGMIGITLARGGYTVWQDNKTGKLNIREGKLGDAPKKMLTTITAALPCAIMASLSEFDLMLKQLLQKGVHVKRPRAFEVLGEVERVVLDVNGPIVSRADELEAFALATDEGVLEGGEIPQQDKDAALRAIASLELRAQMHHMAPPVINYAEENGIKLADINDGITEVNNRFARGRGVTGLIEGKQRVTVGSASVFMGEIPADIYARGMEYAKNGSNVSYAKVVDEQSGNVQWAFFSRESGLLKGMKERIQELQDMGVEVWLNSGSSADKVMWVAEQIGLEKPRLGVNVFADMLPDDRENGNGSRNGKVEESQLEAWYQQRERKEGAAIRKKADVVQLARYDGKQVAVLGDDVNDMGMMTWAKASMKTRDGKEAPTGVAMVMENTGAEVMQSNADIVTKYGANELPYLIKASQTLNQDIKLTSRLSIGYVGTLVSSNLFLSFLSKNPVMMAVFHELPTILFMAFSAWRASHIAQGLGQENARPLSIFEALSEGYSQLNGRKNGNANLEQAAQQLSIHDMSVAA